MSTHTVVLNVETCTVLQKSTGTTSRVPTGLVVFWSAALQVTATVSTRIDYSRTLSSRNIHFTFDSQSRTYLYMVQSTSATKGENPTMYCSFDKPESTIFWNTTRDRPKVTQGVYFTCSNSKQSAVIGPTAPKVPCFTVAIISCC
jgi:hypothetical protein